MSRRLRICRNLCVVIEVSLGSLWWKALGLEKQTHHQVTRHMVSFLIDEFQEIGVLANSKGIEGAIRHVAQESENLRFIFSGSNRHILANMFDDRSRPLYNLLVDPLIKSSLTLFYP